MNIKIPDWIKIGFIAFFYTYSFLLVIAFTSPSTFLGITLFSIWVASLLAGIAYASARNK